MLNISFLIFFLRLTLVSLFRHPQDDSRLVFACKHTNDILLRELSNDDGSVNGGPLFVAHLPELVVSPLHHVPDVQENDAVPVPAADLVDRHLFLLALAFEDEV